MHHEPGTMDISQQKGTYDTFMGLTKFSIVASVILLALMALFLL